MRNNYLSETQIKRIANICNATYSKTNKAKLKELSTKYNLTFDQTRQNNMNMFWQLVTDELKQDPKAIDKISLLHITKSLEQNNFISVREMIFERIKQKYESDYHFLCTFDPEQPIADVNAIIRFSQLILNDSIAELLQVDNYEKYFSLKYGISNVNKQARKDGERVINFVDDLLKGIPNKKGFMIALNDYLQGVDKAGDRTIFHNQLFNTDY